MKSAAEAGVTWETMRAVIPDHILRATCTVIEIKKMVGLSRDALQRIFESESVPQSEDSTPRRQKYELARVLSALCASDIRFLITIPSTGKCSMTGGGSLFALPRSLEKVCPTDWAARMGQLYLLNIAGFGVEEMDTPAILVRSKAFNNLAGQNLDESLEQISDNPPKPLYPTEFLPGTSEKILVLEERARNGFQLFHPEDAKDTDTSPGVIWSRSWSR